ncbi:MAG: hypothetical protein B7Z66_12435 [Chromatiales bacterium 21-64-14]|nr:MAG: hypothetical protein B7Z66_12435 [Chromatiales bacterium 21-64-14]HQU16960.1 zinc-dependent peptidase [Gammaproteobacteria bacterium]
MIRQTLRRWWRRRILRRHAIPDPVWNAASRHPLTAGLDAAERARLRAWATLFLRDKQFHGTHDLALTDAMRATIAVQASIPILGLDPDYYDGWSSVIIYPGAFLARREERDAAGVIHQVRHALTGEAWQHGPLILSWEDARADARPEGTASNVVIHECAHKLDMLNGAANGCPSLHEDMDPHTWTEVLSRSYDALCREVSGGMPPALDPYGAENPAEFFAVASETFFTQPHILRDGYPDLYRQLRSFYRQDPAARRERRNDHTEG